ncbi:NAD(P)/FAD-dependent oxidoreductase [Halobacterium salinarum]|uniref:NADH dehydrogenase n=1 Tax=Halobacterium salinarum (strain ATCC 33171 / DSM 3754 / JCM 8978 / NBRC 102687 / NCIMB 764 / 91-R6) TaxID=2597657 RepID=A0A4D6GSM1_HALS9|nr:NAD(P)/FAD-dependent oxidoreductase [Halobacterium salinarum]MDL0125525.1 NAD(P)/FAD-dependent oxidoreductase [Halobacterium salinarum]MDL0136369.1 NAD(P)/FAD-dependent oxidoreductase [Halobacterium salinarum]QCC44749.1 putative NADH dehydrogenase [Halobacterium salinarum]TYO75502.1 NADH dehydrogenase [Halobacterium salinarum DSM 3754]
MTTRVVVLGAGYAGAGAIAGLESELGPDAELVWVADTDYHLVLHEAHRVIRDPGVQEKITIPVEDIKSRTTEFIEDSVTDIDIDERSVSLADGDDVAYDYLVVGIGSETATYGIEGMAEHPLTLKSLDDAMEIHEQVREAAQDATRDDPANVVIGGAGLSGIQSAGEVAEFRDRHNAPIDVTLVEALPEIFPPGDSEIQGALRHRLEDAGVTILTDDPITAASEDAIEFDERDSLDYDVFVWTGGVTGPSELSDVEMDAEHNRLQASSTLQADDERVFAVGDCSMISQGNDDVAPPTAQAAWQAADVVARNVARAMEGRPLETWTYEDQGTLVSVGETAIAHDVEMSGIAAPIRTFGNMPAKVLKKGAAARWIAKITSWSRAMKAWDAL